MDSGCNADRVIKRVRKVKKEATIVEKRRIGSQSIVTVIKERNEYDYLCFRYLYQENSGLSLVAQWIRICSVNTAAIV